MFIVSIVQLTCEGLVMLLVMAAKKIFSVIQSTYMQLRKNLDGSSWREVRNSFE